MLCLSGFELYSPWAPLLKVNYKLNVDKRVALQVSRNGTKLEQYRSSITKKQKYP